MTALPHPTKPYRDLNSYLLSQFGERVQKITLDAGLTCPNRDGRVGTGGCIYCNPRGSGTGAWVQGKSITTQLQEGLARLGRRYQAKKFIAYFQSFCNTYAPLDQLKSLYEEALAFPEVVGLSIGTRPDCLSEEILELLAHYARTHLVWLELGLQSAHDATLRRINRGHDVACFSRAVEQAAGRGLHLLAHVILGLPGEGRAEILATADYLAARPLMGVKIHLLYIIRGTRLEHLYRRGDYQPLTEDKYVSLVVDFLERLPPQMVIHRLTGDPHREELVAPTWCLHKAGVLEGIRQTFAARRSYQGKLWHPENARSSSILAS
ncbi:MAG: TIGR01212 family radical SAM protein [Deltaproteobacteria bacterium]|nr:TIGR01212 family radical SAM protein [Deltaproteobacteria bacterium]MBW1987490.1 TIGR01212 family radical SAM protein [Deltaproteobacteria bacterium]MBW2134526.1 TIGR01212 family radical SAM protein [Deltaproteobacteria bacterium]